MDERQRRLLRAWESGWLCVAPLLMMWLLVSAGACESKLQSATPTPAPATDPPPSAAPDEPPPAPPRVDPVPEPPEPEPPPPFEPPPTPASSGVDSVEAGPGTAVAASGSADCDRAALAKTVTRGCADLASEPLGGPCIQTLPKILQGPKPEMCPSVRDGGPEGKVVMKVTIGCDGDIERVRLERSLATDCDELAIEMMKGASFTAAQTVDGTPARVTIRYVIDYRMAD